MLTEGGATEVSDATEAGGAAAAAGAETETPALEESGAAETAIAAAIPEPAEAEIEDKTESAEVVAAS
jgi:hypothetical protein